jgi:hypothetical protein
MKPVVPHALWRGLACVALFYAFAIVLTVAIVFGVGEGWVR